MRFNCNKTVLVLSTIGLFASGVASATGSSSGCNVNTGCDSWTNASVYDLTTSEHNYQVYENIDPTNSTVVVNGVSISVTAWSDTAGGGSDDIVTSASMSGPYGEGFGIINQDEDSFDRHDHYHAVDNMGNATDYDMILFSFSEAVSLTGATFSWAGGYSWTQQVTVAGLSDINQLTSGSASWNDISSSIDDSMKGSFQMGHDGTYYSDFTTSGTSQYWLVGAYNSLFAYVDGFSKHNDAFKLSSIGFNQVEDNNGEPDPVNAPSSFALLLLAGGFAAWRKKQAK
ncbi:hypothetical protein EXU34_21940 [Alteromonas sp. ZYF713]|nr:hypothetical protein [Alteromonas sp. ZYF713]